MPEGTISLEGRKKGEKKTIRKRVKVMLAILPANGVKNRPCRNNFDSLG
jgi:hypothetical protein